MQQATSFARAAGTRWMRAASCAPGRPLSPRLYIRKSVPYSIQGEIRWRDLTRRADGATAAALHGKGGHTRYVGAAGPCNRRRQMQQATSFARAAGTRWMRAASCAPGRPLSPRLPSLVAPRPHQPRPETRRGRDRSSGHAPKTTPPARMLRTPDGLTRRSDTPRGPCPASRRGQEM